MRASQPLNMITKDDQIYKEDDHPVLCESRSASPSVSIRGQSNYIIDNDRLTDIQLLSSNIDDVGDHNDDFDSPIPTFRPKLVKRDACHIPQGQLNKSDNKIINNMNEPDYVPDFTVINKFASFPYIKYADIVTHGFIRDIGANLQHNNNNGLLLNIIPLDIFGLVNKYSYCEQDGILQFGYFVSCILSKLGKKKIAFALGVSGMELMKQIKKYIKGFSAMSDDQILYLCNKLIQSKILRPIATNYVFGGIFDTMFVPKSKYLYEINQRKSKIFNDYIKYESMKDKLAWNIGTVIQINSPSNGGWQSGTISSINEKKVTVLFSNETNEILKKTLNRFKNNNKLRSTSKFIKTRENWKIGDFIQVYSHSKHQWFNAQIKDIKIRNNEKSYIEDFKVVYDNNCFKFVNRWSPDLRNCIKKNMKFASGQSISVWSNSQKQWINGHIKVLIEKINCVLVKYGKSEKIIHVNSKQLKLSQS